MLKKWTLKKFFPRFPILVLKPSSFITDFTYHGFLFPPKNRDKWGLPVRVEIEDFFVFQLWLLIFMEPLEVKSCYVPPRGVRESETLFSHSYSSLGFHPHLKRKTKQQQHQKFSLSQARESNSCFMYTHKNSVQYRNWNTNGKSFQKSKS